MDKVLDWNRMYKAPLRGKRGKYGSYKELLSKSREKLKLEEDRKKEFKILEPHLKKSLLHHMVSKTPIKVMVPITYLTEEVQKGKYGTGQYHTTNAKIPANTELIFQQYDKTLDQFIFKSTDGKEYCIYSSPTIAIPDYRGVSIPIPNTGLAGLLLSTNIYTDLMETLKND